MWNLWDGTAPRQRADVISLCIKRTCHLAFFCVLLVAQPLASEPGYAWENPYDAGYQGDGFMTGSDVYWKGVSPDSPWGSPAVPTRSAPVPYDDVTGQKSSGYRYGDFGGSQGPTWNDEAVTVPPDPASSGYSAWKRNGIYNRYGSGMGSGVDSRGYRFRSDGAPEPDWARGDHVPRFESHEYVDAPRSAFPNYRFRGDPVLPGGWQSQPYDDMYRFRPLTDRELERYEDSDGYRPVTPLRGESWIGSPDPVAWPHGAYGVERAPWQSR